MLARIRSFLESLVHVEAEDALERQRIRSLLVMLLLVIVANVFAAVVVLTRPFDLITVMTWGVLPIFVGLYVFARRGHLWPRYAFLAFLLATFPVFFRDTFNTLSAVAFAIPVVVAPLIAAPWLAFPVALVEAVTLYAMSRFTGTPVDFMLGMVFATLAVTSWLTSANFMQVTEVAQRNAAALEDANRILRDNRMLLEERSLQLERRAAYLEATATVARDAVSEVELSVPALLDRVVQLISAQFDLYHAGVFLLDDAREWAVLHAASSVGGQRLLQQGHRLAVGGASTVGFVTANGEPRLLLDVQAEQGAIFENPQLAEARSVLTLPLRARGEVIGALDLLSRKARAFREEDATVLQALADLVGVAISNAQLLDRLQSSIEAERRAYGQVSQQAWSSLLRQRSNLGYRSSERGVTVADRAWGPEARQALREGESIPGPVSEEMNQVPLAVPIKSSGGQVIGVIDTYKPADAGAWTPEELTLLEALSERLGSALESAQFYEASNRRALREQMTREIADNIRSALTVEEAVRRAVHEVARVLRASEMVARLGTESVLLDTQDSGEA